MTPQSHDGVPFSRKFHRRRMNRGTRYAGELPQSRPAAFVTPRVKVTSKTHRVNGDSFLRGLISDRTSIPYAVRVLKRAWTTRFLRESTEAGKEAGDFPWPGSWGQMTETRGPLPACRTIETRRDHLPVVEPGERAKARHTRDSTRYSEHVPRCRWRIGEQCAPRRSFSVTCLSIITIIRIPDT